MKQMSFSLEPPFPTRLALNTVSSSINQITPSDPSIADWNTEYLNSHQVRISFDIDYLLNYANPKSVVLDIGSIPPLFLLSAKKLGFMVKGIDIKPDRYLSSIKDHNLTIYSCDIEREILPFEDDSVDIVIINEVFEHLRIDLIFTFSEIVRVLRTNGHLILSTPNLKSLNGLINFLFRNKGYSCAADPFESYMQLARIGHLGHVREYTNQEVSDFLGKLGLVTDNVIFRGRYRFGKKWKQELARFFPSLSPFFSIIARKS